MRRLDQRSAGATRASGFALLIVLWTLVLIAFLVARLTAAGSAEIHIAGNLAANAAARAAAEGALYQAIFRLSSGRPQDPFELDGVAHEIRIGRSRIALSAENEAARINPNLASPALMMALLRVLGSDPEQSAILAHDIAEWVGQPVSLAQNVAASNPPSTGSSDYRPPRSPLESMNELALVRGMTPTLLAVLRPHLTLFGPAAPDPAAADPAVAAALRLIGELAADTGTPIPAADVLTVHIQAVAEGPDNALATCAAVVRIDPQLPNGYAVLAWNDDGEAFE